MNFQDAIKICFQKYVDFNGRAARPEFWWWFLFCILCSIVVGLVSEMLANIFSLATLIPSLAVGSRRLHDINKSGWFQLIWFFGWIIGAVVMLVTMLNGNYAFIALGAILILASFIYMIYLHVQVGDADDNRFGAPPEN